MRNDFCVFILTHGRPNNVRTLKALKNSNYTGPIFLLIDDEDSTADQYFSRYGDQVLQFSKAHYDEVSDKGDNFPQRRSILFARNACFDFARQLGYRFFIQLDDDYQYFMYKINGNYQYCEKPIRSLDNVWSAMTDYLASTPFASIAMAQTGDYIGGKNQFPTIKTKRKAMNSFICDTEKPFVFHARINEDVTTYTTEQRRGLSFLTLTQVSLKQASTQAQEGGLTELYLETGTYVKSFYSVMFAPSCVKITILRGYAINAQQEKTGHARIHHQVNWNATAPRIIREKHRKR